MSTDQFRERIHEILPDLQIDHLVRNEEGLINDILIANHELVFRFAKNDGFAQILNAEMDVLDLVRPRVEIPVPSPTYRGPGSVVYPLLHGQDLMRKTLQQMGADVRDGVAAQLGAFLYQLHTTPTEGHDWIPSVSAPITHEKWTELRARIEEKVYPLLLNHQIVWAEDLFERVLADPTVFDYTPALIHRDLAPYHILYDESTSKITGIIDFGVSGLGDPALDLGTLITHYGQDFVNAMSGSYPGLDAHMVRARFYAQAKELQWALLGLETGDTFWFTAHLGSARDVSI